MRENAEAFYKVEIIAGIIATIDPASLYNRNICDVSFFTSFIKDMFYNTIIRHFSCSFIY